MHLLIFHGAKKSDARKIADDFPPRWRDAAAGTVALTRRDINDRNYGKDSDDDKEACVICGL